MITFTQIHQVSDEIARRFRPERIILFGSYAYGTPTEDSDVDLLVVLPFEGRTAKQAHAIRSAVYAGFAMDLIPITPDRLKYRLEIEDFFLREVVEKGQVLYETDYARVG